MKKIQLFIFVIFLFFPIAPIFASSQATDEMSVDFLGDEYEEEVYEEGDVYDPLEPMNRVFFEFNDKLYFWVLKPAKRGYKAILHEDIRQCIGNFFYNLASPIRLVNNLLQGKFEGAGVVISRFFINTTLGVFGFGDPAQREFHLDPQPADFGQTLGIFGLGEGLYFCWPVLGPSNVRDTAGLVADIYMHPIVYTDIMNTTEVVISYSVNRLNTLSLAPDVYEDMKKYALDPYIATRQAYYDYRKSTTQPPEERELDF